jgi:hypothetical protein
MRPDNSLYPKMLNGTRKKLSNLVLNFATYLWDTTLAAISKMQITFKDKARADEKAESRLRRDEQYILRRSATQ